MDIYPPHRQREALLRLAPALGCRESALRRDDCGDWRINGKHGHIYAIPGTLAEPGREGFLLCYNGSARAWGFAKAAMRFAQVTQDGCLFLDRLPTKAEAAVIRAKLGMAKKPEYDEETLARKREQALLARQFMASKSPPSTEPLPSYRPALRGEISALVAESGYHLGWQPGAFAEAA
jgi:hypothetical protein